MSAGLVVRWRCSAKRRLGDRGSREEELRGGPVLHPKVFDKCNQEKEGDLERMECILMLLGGQET